METKGKYMTTDDTLDALRLAAEQAEESVAALVAEQDALPTLQQNALNKGDNATFWALDRRAKEFRTELFLARTKALQAAVAMWEAMGTQAESETPALVEQYEAIMAEIAPLQAKAARIGDEIHRCKTQRKAALDQKRTQEKKLEALQLDFMQGQRIESAPVVRSLQHIVRA